ncbi:sugar transferase [Planctomicrobium piriforme]|uniref:Sugar transferase involved in LPS biosynthesis (Colanic, teichoic acid) n=1 Tax=Planctomicrobium piriforme TaxID=1576369 RepID=A0A1I3JEX0_9PLAN|nr:sugar transferase [Planctomicrobium piriforme]SFI58660.1 Sugar transferase involved in LPS biosynthesis (colanic, teichoic acid) [Planctomicrobium piriforme]
MSVLSTATAARTIPGSAPVPAAPAAASTGSTLQQATDFAGTQQFPKVWWLTPLQLTEERANIQSVPASTRFAKRALDIVVALTMLVCLAPLMAVVALLVKLTSKGPVIYSQTRVGLNLRKKTGIDRRQDQSGPPEGVADRRLPGRDRRATVSYGRHFTIYKFRTMRTDAELQGARFAVKGDSRITPIGRLLRKTRLDELPQLLNVLRGEMSLVGPRPERPEFIKPLSDEIPGYLDRLGLQPGLTGVAQILNGYDNEIDSFRRKVAFDLYYLQNCSLGNDFKILVRTVHVVLTGSGAL